MDTCSLDTGAPRAATTLVPRLRATTPTVRDVWRGDEWIHSGACNSTSPDYTPTGFAALDQELPGAGWPRGQLVELLVDDPGVGELGLLLPALAGLAHTGRSCVWVLPCQPGATRPDPALAPSNSTGGQALPYAPALAEAGLELAHHIFVKPLTARESGWALEQSLRTAHLGALIGWLPDTTSSDADFRELRRLHLLAQKHGALVFVLRTARHARSPSPAALRLRLDCEAGLLRVQILKRRGRPLLEPIALQVHPARWNCAPAGIAPQATGTGIPATDPAPTVTASPEDSIVIGTSAPANGKTPDRAPAPGIALDARVSGSPPAAIMPWRMPTLRRLMKVFAPQKSWSMPAALSQALSSAI